MEAAQRIEIACDRAPALRNVVPGVVAAIGNRLGAWKVVVRDLHGGTGWEVRIHRPDGAEDHYVFPGADRTPDDVRKTIERELAHHDAEHVL
jgi:hypothetical protein